MRLSFWTKISIAELATFYYGVVFVMSAKRDDPLWQVAPNFILIYRYSQRYKVTQTARLHRRVVRTNYWKGNKNVEKKPCHAFACVFVCTKVNQGLEVTKRQRNARVY